VVNAVLIDITVAPTQAVLNEHARLAIWALSRLGGYLPGAHETPKNPVIRKCLRGLLTPYLANRLVDEDPVCTKTRRCL
jgi:hypothetical protein